MPRRQRTATGSRKGSVAGRRARPGDKQGQRGRHPRPGGRGRGRCAGTGLVRRSGSPSRRARTTAAARAQPAPVARDPVNGGYSRSPPVPLWWLEKAWPAGRGGAGPVPVVEVDLGCEVVSGGGHEPGGAVGQVTGAPTGHDPQPPVEVPGWPPRRRAPPGDEGLQGGGDGRQAVDTRSALAVLSPAEPAGDPGAGARQASDGRTRTTPQPSRCRAPQRLHADERPPTAAACIQAPTAPSNTAAGVSAAPAEPRTGAVSGEPSATLYTPGRSTAPPHGQHHVARFGLGAGPAPNRANQSHLGQRLDVVHQSLVVCSIPPAPNRSG